MIAKVAPQRRSGRGSAADLRAYLERDANGLERSDLVATWSGNVAAHATADLEMDATAQRGRSPDPLLHIVLSWRPGENVSEDVAYGAIEATLRSLGTEDRQWFAAMHDDGERVHVHLGINRVDPQTRNLFDVWKIHAKIARAAEWVEREYGCLPDRRMDWRSHTVAEVSLGRVPDQNLEHVREGAPGLSLVPPGAATPEMDAARRAGYSWTALVREEAVPAVHATMQREHASWERVHASLETFGLRMEAAGSGARIVGAEPGLHLKASRVGLDMRGMETTLGPFVAPSRAPTPYEERLQAAREAVAVAKTWEQVHTKLGELGLALDGNKRGGRVVDLETDGRKTACRTALDTSLGMLEKRFGPYEASPQLVAQQAREYERRAEGVATRAEILVRDPGMIVARIAEHRSTWDRAEAEREVRAVLDVGPGKEWDGPVQRVLDAALVPEHTVSLGFVASVNAEARPGRQSGDRPEVELDAGREIFSTAAIVADERAMHEAARALAAQTRAPGMPELRAPSGELDAQQRGAYACIAGGSGLAIVQGIAGAGKSRMLRDVAAAYTDAGYRVLGAAVSGDAARVLGEEAQIATQTIARLRTNLGAGRERLDGRTVLLVDEASMLGTSDARELLEAARDGGAVVRLLGDAEQHGSVARGTVLADLSREHGAYDMALSRRAQEPWLREVAGDLRAGLTSRALGELREHGAIAEHRTTAEAKAALIDGWARDVLAERDVLLIATRRTDVADLNERARRAFRERLGEERTYTTAFGERAFAIGEQLVARKADRASETVNGDRLRVLGHREDGRIACERVRDGAALVWDVKERPEIDYGYAATSYRSQGSTVDAVYVLATRADDRRGIYVDATRARQHVTIAYGRDEVENFGAMLALGAQERGECSVADSERSASLYERGRAARRDEIQKMAEKKAIERERGRGMDFGR